MFFVSLKDGTPATLLRCKSSIRLMPGSGQIRPPRDFPGMSVLPPKAVVNADIFLRPVPATSTQSGQAVI